MHRGGPLGRVRLLRYQYRGHNENQTELLGRHRGGDAVQLAHVGGLLCQVPDRQEAQLRVRRGAVQQGHHFVVPDRGRHHGGGLGGRCRGTGEAEASVRQQEEQVQAGDAIGDAHAPAVGRPEVGQRGLVRDQRAADEERHTGGHHQLRAVYDPDRRLRRHLPVHVSHLGGVRFGVPAPLQQGVRHGQQERRARLVGGHASGAAPDHRAQLYVLRRAVLIRRVADRHVLERRQHPDIHAGNRAPAVRHKQLSQQGRVGHRHVQGRQEVAERRRRGPGPRMAGGPTERRAAGRAQGAQGPGELDRRAPAGPRGHHGQRGRHVRGVGHRAVHAAVDHVLVDDIHQRQVPSQRRPTAHVRHQQVHRFLGGTRRIVNSRDRRVIGVGVELARCHAKWFVYVI